MLFLFGLLECFPYGLPSPADALLVRMRIHPPYGAAIGMFQTCGTWQNLTATTANTVTGAFERTLDAAWLKVSTGAFDYKTAVKQAVDSLADDMPMVTYPSGHKDSIEVAARRAVLTGVNQTAGWTAPAPACRSLAGAKQVGQAHRHGRHLLRIAA